MDFLPTLGRSAFPQFFPVDPFENELYEGTMKSISSKNEILAQQSCLKKRVIVRQEDRLQILLLHGAECS